MVEISSSLREKEIYRVDSPFNEDSKNIPFLPRKALISEEGLAGKFRENGQ